MSDSSDTGDDDSSDDDAEDTEGEAAASADDKSDKKDGGSTSRDLGALFDAVDSEVCLKHILQFDCFDYFALLP